MQSGADFFPKKAKNFSLFSKMGGSSDFFTESLAFKKRGNVLRNIHCFKSYKLTVLTKRCQ